VTAINDSVKCASGGTEAPTFVQNIHTVDLLYMAALLGDIISPNSINNSLKFGLSGLCARGICNVLNWIRVR
jgi:hypothetical protein